MRKHQFCRRRVKLSLRVQRYYGTVGLTVMHGLEGVPLTQTLLRKVMSFDRRNLKSMLCLKKHTGEDWVDFYKRQMSLLRQFMCRAGIMELAARLIAKQHGWAGHVTRLAPSHIAHCWSCTGTLEDWHLKQAIYSTLDPSNSLAWRHKSKGANTHWESNLSRALGDHWRYQASDRKAWRSSRSHFVQQVSDLMLGSGSKLLGCESGCKSVCQVLRPELGWAPDLMWVATHEGFRGGTTTTKCGQGVHGLCFHCVSWS